MEVNVENESYIPNSDENIIISALKNMKVSFVLLLIIIICIYIGLFMLLDNSNGNSNPIQKVVVLVFEILLWAVLLYVVYINIKNSDAKNYDFRQKMENLFDTKIAELSVHASSDNNEENEEKKENDKVICDGNEDNSNKEVFHIFGNKYNYNEAKEACKVYDAKLATYEQVEQAYNNGANWCSYGWSEDQMAFFPTQQSVYNELKQIPGHENDCGRPGINGGYMKNPNIKFGVNCYGIKPEAKDKDKKLMHSVNHTPYINEDEINKKKNEKKSKLNKFSIYPFNNDKWSVKN
tara:strand:- start:1227 stop:2105 length:879 start_codon:yes stop_codon:yes gene_type:complete